MNKGKTVLITGSSRGIGAEAARLFNKCGYNVVINYNNSEQAAVSLYNDLSENNPNVMLIKADISDRKEVESMFKMINKQFGGVDVLVNNAGIAEQKLFIDLTEQDFERMINTNLKGAFNCTQLSLPYMINNHYGKVINISSVWGISGSSMEVSYSTAKSAIIGFTKALAKEYGPSNIMVNCIAPGVIDTDMNKHLSKDSIDELIRQTPLSRLGKASEVAELILFLASEKSDFITGQIIGIDGGF